MSSTIRSIVPPWSAAALYAALVLALWPVPVLNILHVESAAVVSVAAFFVAGLHALPAFRRGEPIGTVLLQQQSALAVPWFLLTVTLLWTPNCGYFQGLAFFLLFPVITVAFAVALSYALSGWQKGPQRTLFVLAGLAIMIGGPVYDIGFHPQLYTYNHIFGGVLGPIYDEELAVRSGLFTFRGLTLLWAGWLFLLGLWLRGQMPRTGRRWWIMGPPAVVVLTVAIGLAYIFSAPLGFNTPAWYLKQQLGGHLATTHFDIYFDPEALSEDELRRVARYHEYHYARLSELLDEEVTGRVASYIYPTPDVKASLTGARYTSVAPVWLASPQMHLLQPRMGPVLPHELAHVFSREFGLPVVNASLAVGLVEGLAVALEPPDRRPHVHDLVAADLTLGVAHRGGGSSTLAMEVAQRLSPLGFWTGRGTVSYTTMGSFVRYLIDTYGIERFKGVYPHGAFEAVYGKPLEKLAADWEQHLRGRTLMARAAADHVARRFAIPSLFERRCPHYVPPHQRYYRSAERALAAGDTSAAFQALTASLAAEPRYRPALDRWARLQLAEGNAEPTIERLSALDEDQRSAALHARLGEAYALAGRSEDAVASYRAALRSLPLYAYGQRVRIHLQLALVAHPGLVQLVHTDHAADDVLPPTDELREHPAAQMLKAIRLAEDEHYAEAVLLFETARPHDFWQGGTRAIVEQQRLMWLAEIYYRQERYEKAEAAAGEAAGVLHEVGDTQGAGQREAFAERMRWLRAYEEHGPGARISSMFSLD